MDYFLNIKHHEFFMLLVILSVILIAVKKLIQKNEKNKKQQKIAENYYRCRFCDEYIRKKAVLCKHCGSKQQES